MKVFNLSCEFGHGFEGWFGSEDDYLSQMDRGLITCPICDSPRIERRPSAPRLNLGAKPEAAASTESPATAVPADAPLSPFEAQLIAAVREVLAKTEDVGTKFADEARRIHHGEAEQRSIRGQATPAEREALADEGIEVVQLPVPKSWTGSTH